MLCAKLLEKATLHTYGRRARHFLRSEQDAKLAQKLGQLQTFLAVSPQERRVNLHLLGLPTTFLARVTSSRAHTSLAL